jgi:hypothetical protein
MRQHGIVAHESHQSISRDSLADVSPENDGSPKLE